MATKQRCFIKCLIHHSDKDPQYTSYRNQRELNNWGMCPNFTGTEACLDNAYIESFFAILKKELVYQSDFHTRDEARASIVDFINMYFNSWRLDSSLGYLCPNDFETRALERLAT